jgi:Fe-S-cluster-containing hydrogenase component 2
MCGAIKMVNQNAVVDQFSCMSCHECVDICEWNAIELTTGSRHKNPKRVRKNIDIHPEPNWQSTLKVKDNKKAAKKAEKKPKKLSAAQGVAVLFAVSLLTSLIFIIR